MNHPRRVAAAFAAGIVLALGAAGCGGSDDAKKTPTTADGPPAQVAERAKNAVALETEAAEGAEPYEITGKLVADSGFRPSEDGFNFENYGNEDEPENLTPANLEELFGEDVCLSGTGEDCVLTPAGDTWMEEMNEAMGGGHCMGFSVLALRVFSGALKPSDLQDGAETVFDVDGDDPFVQSEIAEAFIYQDIPAIQKEMIEDEPNAILEFLKENLATSDEVYTLGIWLKEGVGGHAVTPVAVEDKGDGVFAVLVYDNNYPDQLRPVTFDTTENTYEYVGGTNPSETGLLFGGGPEDTPADLTPTTIGEQILPCPFCEDTEAGGDEDEDGTKSAAAPAMSELTLQGNVENHPHLVITDEEGNTTGFVDGVLKEEIEGIEVIRRYSQRVRGGARSSSRPGAKPGAAVPEPKFRIPAGLDINISIDGSDLEKRAKSTVNFLGNGLVVSVEEIVTAPGQVDELFLSGDGYGFVYKNNAKDEYGSTPLFFGGVDDGERSWTFGATASNLKKGAEVGLIIDKGNKAILLDADDRKGKFSSKGFYSLVIGMLDEDANAFTYAADLELDGSKGEDGFFSYAKRPKKNQSQTVDVLDDDAETVDTVKAKPF